MESKNMRLLFDSESISRRVNEIGQEISRGCSGEELLLVGILKGGFMFLADLARAIERPCRIDFARIASYGDGTTSSGSLNIIMDVGLPIEGKDVVLVDDIVDTGLTLGRYMKALEARNPRSLKLAAFIDKTARREHHVNLDYYGFRIDDGFLVGYGLDCGEKWRNLRGIYVIDE
jgi:hypoxanthine phosphoribosyltransferase